MTARVVYYGFMRENQNQFETVSVTAGLRIIGWIWVYLGAGTFGLVSILSISSLATGDDLEFAGKILTGLVGGLAAIGGLCLGLAAVVDNDVDRKYFVRAGQSVLSSLIFIGAAAISAFYLARFDPEIVATSNRVTQFFEYFARLSAQVALLSAPLIAGFQQASNFIQIAELIWWRGIRGEGESRTTSNRRSD